MKDFLGVDYGVGDRVVFMQLNYRNLLIGEVVRETPKMVFIKHGTSETKQFHGQVIKVAEE